tara:strand:+ start:698 stop:1573 length:876 start_codon:yes stop_codon:yes gene_type:complete
MSEFRVNSITNQNGSAGPTICGVTTFSGKSGMQIPSGRTGGRAGVGDINRDGLIFYVDAAYSRIGGKDPIHDLSSFGKMGELRNGASVISDHGGVFLLDGTDDFVLFPPIEEKLTDFTFIVWCYHDSVESGDAPFSYGESFSSDKAKCVIRTNNGSGMSWWFEAPDDSDYNIYSNSNTVDRGENPLTTINDFPSTTWAMVTAQWDDAKMKQIMHVGTTSYNNLYSNGLTRRERPADISGDGPVTIGCRTNSGNNYQSFWDGQVAMACIYNRVLDDAELTQIWNDTSGRLGY